MKKIKKAMSILISLSLAAGLAACGNGSGSNNNNNNSSSSNNNNSGPAAETGSTAAVSSAAASGSENTAITPPSSPHKYSVAAGSVGGTFYLMGGGVAQIINKQLPDYFMFTSETTGGGTANMELLQAGDAELGIVNTSSLYESLRGEAEWTNGQIYDKIRGAAALYPTYFTCYTMESSGINSLSDLNGKKVGLGSKGMSMDSVMRQFFDDMGIVPAQIHNDGHAATATALGDGVIDAAITFSYPPFAAINELESTNSLKFIGMTSEEQAYFLDKYDFYKADELPANSYKGNPEGVKGVSEYTTLVTTTEVSADEVYLMVKALYENQADLIAVHKSAENMTTENVLKFNIPLHAGVVRYLKEVGIDVPAELIPAEYSE